MDSFDQPRCFECGYPLIDFRCLRCTCARCGFYCNDGFCSICNSFAYDSNPNSFNDPQNFSDHPPQNSVIHQLPRRSNKEMLLEMAKLIKVNRTILNSNILPHEEMSMGVLLAKERNLKIIQIWDEKQIDPWNLPELLRQLSNNSQIIAEILKQREEKRIEEAKRIEEEQVAKIIAQRKLPVYYDNDDDGYMFYCSPAIASQPVLQTVEPENSLSMGDEHLSTIPITESSSVKNLVPIPSEFEDISNDGCDLSHCDNSSPNKVLEVSDSIPPGNKNDHFNAEFDLINSLLSRDSSYTSPKFNFLPKEFVGELTLLDPILPEVDEADVDEEGEIDIDIFQIKDEALREKLLKVNLLIAKIESLNDKTQSTDFESSSSFLAPEDSIPPGVENDLDSEGDIIFLDDLLNDDPIPLPEFESFTFDIEPNAAVINDFDELTENKCFDPGRGEIVEDDDYPFTFIIRNFLPFLTYPEASPLLLSTGSEDTIFDPGIST
ncbi:hypothetical protein Tco_0996411 [Tanacetum coccineum]